MARRIPSPLLSLIAFVFLLPIQLKGQETGDQVRQLKSEVDQLRALVSDLQSRLAVVEKRDHVALNDSRSGQEDAAALSSAAAALRRADFTPTGKFVHEATAARSSAEETTDTPTVTALPGPATLNYYLDTYFENNFNNPPGRVNNLRSYDVLSRTFSINQAAVVFALDPDVSSGRRYGLRVDLQFGQATETLQGNPANEPRPDIYRNIFQAYGTYVFPLGSGLNFDLGKWASSLGSEGNYTKDQMNYTRSYYFYFLPFYHTGIRLHYNLTHKLGVNYWLVNGTNQSEPTNGYRDELFGFILQPAKKVSWTFNYYLGQEHRDTTPAINCVVPVQPGLCVAPISPAPNGKLHIFDTYATWNATPKLTLVGEADYVIQREWANAEPGQSSAPSHSDGGAGYVQYQFSPRYSVAGRAEYLSDRGGMFSNATQALKEVTATYRYNVVPTLAAFLEYRRDWSNQPYFATDNPAVRSTHQDTAGIGLVWWYGQKEGAW